MIGIRRAVSSEWERGREKKKTTERGHKGTFWGFENALYLAWKIGYMVIYIYQNSSNCTLKIIIHYMKIKINCVSHSNASSSSRGKIFQWCLKKEKKNTFVKILNLSTFTSPKQTTKECGYGMKGPNKGTGNIAEVLKVYFVFTFMCLAINFKLFWRFMDTVKKGYYSSKTAAWGECLRRCVLR